MYSRRLLAILILFISSANLLLADTYRVHEELTCTDESESKLTYDFQFDKFGTVTLSGFGSYRILPSDGNTTISGYTTIKFACDGLIDFQKRKSALATINCDYTNVARYEDGNGVVVTPFEQILTKNLNINYILNFSAQSTHMVGYSDPRAEEIIQINPGLDNEANFPRACTRQLTGIRINVRRSIPLINISE